MTLASGMKSGTGRPWLSIKDSIELLASGVKGKLSENWFKFGSNTPQYYMSV